MAKRAESRNKAVAVWAMVALLFVAVLALSLNAFAEGDSAGDAPSSPSASSSGKASSGSAAPASASSSGASRAGKSEVDRALAQSAVPKGGASGTIDADSAGTVFTFESPLEDLAIPGDLYWAGIDFRLGNSSVGNDVMAIGQDLSFSHADISNDIRVAGQRVALEDVVAQGNVDALALDIAISGDSAATGYYCGGGSISYEGASRRFIAYGQSIYFNGVVEGDVTLSAQEIVIGPDARITGTLDIRSGQSLEVLDIPGTASIGNIDTTLNQPNTIDQITQIRAAIAPYFQVGSLLFAVVSFIILGLAFLWGFGHKLTEANRLIRRYPLAVVVLACIALMLMFVAIMLGSLLVFTIPFSAVVLLFVLISAICCIPFTGASLMLMLRHRIRPSACVILGAGIGGALVFVPYVNVVVFFGSLIYFVGYLVNIAMFGHDKLHDASIHVREADDGSPHGKTSGILPVASPPVTVPVDDAGTPIDDAAMPVPAAPEEAAASQGEAPSADAVDGERPADAAPADSGAPGTAAPSPKVSEEAR